MGESFAISALVRHRAMLKGELATTQCRVRIIEDQLIHVDAVLKMLGLGSDPESIPAGQRPNQLFAHRELQRLVAEIPRETGFKTASPIAAEIIRRKGWDVTSRPLQRAVSGRVRDAIKRQKANMQRLGVNQSTSGG